MTKANELLNMINEKAPTAIHGVNQGAVNKMYAEIEAAKKGKGPSDYGKRDKAPTLIVGVDQPLINKLFDELQSILKKKG